MRLIKQRKKDDCGVASLAMVAGVPYREAWRALNRIGEAPSGDGLSNGDLIAAALQLGIELVPVRLRGQAAHDYALKVRCAVVRVRWSGDRFKKYPGGHFVAIKDGEVFCPDYERSPLAEYLDKYNGRVCTILERAS